MPSMLQDRVRADDSTAGLLRPLRVAGRGAVVRPDGCVPVRRAGVHVLVLGPPVTARMLEYTHAGMTLEPQSAGRRTLALVSVW